MGEGSKEDPHSQLSRVTSRPDPEYLENGESIGVGKPELELWQH